MKKRADHIAILMDGCRLWSTERGLSPSSGLWASALTASATIEAAAQNGVRHLTLIPTDAFATDVSEEASTVLYQFLRSHGETFRHLSLRFSAHGELSRLPLALQQKLHTMKNASAKELGMGLSLLLGYSGRADLLRVARELAAEVRAGKLPAEAISPTLIEQRLITSSLPPVDLIIYTGRGQHLSDALTFESAYAEFAFAPCLWPDFAPEDLQQALADFGHRERRFGKTSAQVQSASPS